MLVEEAVPLPFSLMPLVLVLGDVVEAQKFGYPDFHNNIPYIHDLLNQ
jgi:hypothetical protein